MNEEIFEFLKELRVNNNRDWFHANKSRYDRLREGFLVEIQELINRISLFDPEIAGLEAKNTFFRIYRDIRFSLDKTPYKNHFAAYIAAFGGRKSIRAGYYIHLEPGHSVLSGGAWCPPPQLLKMLRKDIYDQIDEFVGIMEEPVFKSVYPVMEGESLKRMPVGYPSDFEYDYILKHKDFCVASPKSDDYFTASDWMDKTVADFKLLQPFNRFLNYTIEDYQSRV